jgi:hypothetical protein
MPPKPELAGTLPKPTVAQAKPTSGGVTFATPPTTDPTLSPGKDGQQGAPVGSTEKGGSSWGTLLIGVGVGFLLFLLAFGGAVLFMKRRGGSVRSRYKKRD